MKQLLRLLLVLIVGASAATADCSAVQSDWSGGEGN